MSDSVLATTKKALGLDSEYNVFDPEIVMHINSALSTLTQIGVGPSEGFMISDEFDTWTELLGGDPRLNNVKTYIYLKVRLLFDPPAASNLVTAFNEQLREIEWRINVTSEEEKWQDPLNTTIT